MRAICGVTLVSVPSVSRKMGASATRRSTSAISCRVISVVPAPMSSVSNRVGIIVRGSAVSMASIASYDAMCFTEPPTSAYTRCASACSSCILFAERKPSLFLCRGGPGLGIFFFFSNE